MRRIAHHPGQEAGEDQHREHLEGDVSHISPEAQRRRGVHQRNHQRNQERARQVDDDQVRHRSGQVAAQAVGNDPGGRRRRTDHAQHGAFQHKAEVGRLHQPHQKGQDQETAHLHGQGAPMPAAEPEVVRRDFHELEKQQGGDHQPLPLRGQRVQPFAEGMQGRGEMVNQIEADSQDDRQRQHPVFDELDGFIHDAAPAGRRVYLSGDRSAACTVR